MLPRLNHTSTKWRNSSIAFLAALSVALGATASANAQVIQNISYPKIGDVIGQLYIPAIRMSIPIIEGTGEKELKRGVGHYRGSVLPGLKNNSVLSAHRDTYFANIGKLKKGDRIVVKTETARFTYQIMKFRIVMADDRTVIVPTPKAVLTLSTCYPFIYIGHAPKRYIVSSELISKQDLVKTTSPKKRT